MTANTTVTVEIIKSDFNRGLKYAKTFGGTYNPTSKTWTLPLTDQVRASLSAASAYGLRVVSTTNTNHEANCYAYYGGAGCECK